MNLLLKDMGVSAPEEDKILFFTRGQIGPRRAPYAAATLEARA